MIDYKTARENMIESQIRPNAVTQKELIKALHNTPRELFVPPSQRSLSYMDGALQVEAAGEGRPARFLLSPMIFAKMAQLADIRSADKVLDVGAATGYSSAILAQLAKQVIALEPDAGLAALAKDALAEQRIENVEVVSGPLADGSAAHAPFDVIFINGRLGCDPDTLFPQLAPNGRLIAIMGSEAAPKAQLFRKIGNSIQKIMGFDANAPLLPGFDAKDVFAF
jgi:protein-L-isoaspartate(D-aspartate) O-methyltransferase